MNRWTSRIFAAAAALLLSGCLWGPGKFTSDLTVRKNGTFVLDYRGEIVLQFPDDANKISRAPWTEGFVRCYADGEVEKVWWPKPVVPEQKSADESRKTRPCTRAEIEGARTEYEKEGAQQAAQERESREQTAKLFGLPGLDDESNRAFAAKLMKYAGWRSVAYRGKGVFDVDYHLEGRATQDFLFPALPDNDLIIPFIAIRRRTDGSVLVTAPAFTGGSGPLAARLGQAAAASASKDGPKSRAQGRFTVITDGEILTNNSEDGATPHAIGRQVHWDVTVASTKVPETLIRLQ
jgi:hypothetical protein